MVGVEGSKDRPVQAARSPPVITGYAGHPGSKFRTANATQVTNQLLATARTDTISGGLPRRFMAAASQPVARALAPIAIR